MNLVHVKVWGPLACFTRPELKVERVTYDVMTPSAAHNLLKAIFWKPEFDYQITEIHVLNPIEYVSITRNEIKDRQTPRQSYIAASERRTQRTTLALKDVAYVIKARIHLESHATAPVQKYTGMFMDRVERGRNFHSPYLGLREFHAYFTRPTGSERPIDVTRDLGMMLLRLNYQEDERGPFTFTRHGSDGARTVKGRAVPEYFGAHLDNGILRVPGHDHVR
ncbi:type I-C CRISPR-associated protein Cas5c [Deinococcus yavapaiensis]|uniref:pre-crRNA processing endonuclease n=1 Tax=Deinococcus yavapaiensis KR-236 TaxID=694435 RepID=A0A318SLR6_9DEIO|nr:type I-C CRISPR-associated protein Cas5c [Deinococcus yavapaiensis]PYE55479.1 CRISPR-associated Cas5d family protein [Deinococcus yavapaiensis KR-236]